MTEPKYEDPTITDVVDIIDLLRPWMHGFTLVELPLEGCASKHFAVCDCGWTTEPEFGIYTHAIAYQRHVGYEA